MNKFKHTILTISAILMIVITLSFQSNITSANNTAQRINMIAIDPNTLTYEYGRNAIKSFMTLSSTLKDGDSFYILMMDDTDKLYGPYVAGNINFDSYNEDLKKIIDSKKPIKPFSLTKSLTESYDFFSINKVAAGSYLYLIIFQPLRK